MDNGLEWQLIQGCHRYWNNAKHNYLQPIFARWKVWFGCCGVFHCVSRPVRVPLILLACTLFPLLLLFETCSQAETSNYRYSLWRRSDITCRSKIPRRQVKSQTTSISVAMKFPETRNFWRLRGSRTSSSASRTSYSHTPTSSSTARFQSTVFTMVLRSSRSQCETLLRHGFRVH